MDIVKEISVLPMGDAVERRSDPQNQDRSDNKHSSAEHKDQTQNENSAVVLAGLTSYSFSPEVCEMFETMAAEIEAARMEGE